MNTKTSIFNLALGHLACGSVTIDTEVSVPAETLSRVWDSSRQEVLRQKNWNFATVIEALTESGNYTPPAEWLFAYTYPAKALAVWKVYNSALVNSPLLIDSQIIVPSAAPLANIQAYLKKGEPFHKVFDKINNQVVLLSNCAEASVEYTYDVDNIGVWDASFVTLMGFRLAAEAAFSLTGLKSIELSAVAAYNTAAQEAKRVDQSENNTESFGNGRIIDSRS